MANEFAVNQADLTSIADAIREKSGASDALVFPNGFVDAIANIETGGGGFDIGSIADGTISGEISSDTPTNVRTHAFSDCAQLTSVSFPNAARIYDSAFENCSSLVSANFPKVVTFGSYCFRGCSNLTSITASSEISSISTSAFQNCSSLTNVDNLFATKNSKLRSLGTYAFMGCSSLEKVTALWLRTLDKGAFQQCTNLHTIELDGYMQNQGTIASRAFYKCSSLTSVVIRFATTMWTLSNVDAFSGTPIESGTGYIYVQPTLLDSYKAATNWSTYANQIKSLSEYTG